MTTTYKKPVALTPDTGVIAALSEQVPDSRWGVWRYQEANGRLAKVPYSASGKRLSTAEPARWGTFDDARTAYETGGPDGLALLVTSSDLLAVDIDGCLADDWQLKAETPQPVREAVEVLRAAGAYVEISPSGSGLRALLRGTKPPLTREKNAALKAELYDGRTNGRYVTVTGRVWGGAPVRIIDGGDTAVCLAELLGLTPADSAGRVEGPGQVRKLKALSDDEIAAKVKQGGGRGLGARLFAGNLDDYAGDHSAADLALAVLVARWTDDPAQVERVFSLSALASRAKWTDRADYRQRTVAQALESVRTEAAAKDAPKRAAEAKVAESLADGNSHLSDWLAEHGGKVPKTVAGVAKLLRLDSRVMGLLGYDSFAESPVKFRAMRAALGESVPLDDEPTAGQFWTDLDSLGLLAWLDACWGISVRKSELDEAVTLASLYFRTNSVTNVLDGLVWDGVPRLDTFLTEYLGADEAEEDAELLRNYGRKWLISAVARAYEPGCKADHVLVAVGGEEVGKSTSVKVLAEAIAPRAFRENIPPISTGDKEAVTALLGGWILELSELASFTKGESEAVKSFITRREDNIRLAYDRRTKQLPRRCVFFGTSNDPQFVIDRSGGRRYWAFRVTKPINVRRIERDARLIWAEAVSAYRSGESWWIEEARVKRMAQKAQRRRMKSDGYDELIVDKLMEPVIYGLSREAAGQWRMQSLDIHRLLGFPDGEIQRNGRRLHEGMERLGFTSMKSKGASVWKISDWLLEDLALSN